MGQGHIKISMEIIMVFKNGQALTGGQMPANGVPEPTQPKEAAPGVQIIEKNPAPAPAAPNAVPAAPPAPAMAVVDVGAINRAAQQQVPAQSARKFDELFLNFVFYDRTYHMLHMI